MLKFAALSSGLVLLQQKLSSISMDSEKLNTTKNAVCVLFPKDNSGVQGMVSFQQENYGTRTKVVAVIRGLKPNSLHGLHTHEFGDFQDVGQIYNPFSRRHGGPLDKERKVGSLGNIKTDERGNGYLAFEDSSLQLHGDNTYIHNKNDSILGRSIAVKEEEDDLGRGGKPTSSVDGNAGKIVACGIIGITNAFKNLQPHE